MEQCDIMVSFDSTTKKRCKCFQSVSSFMLMIGRQTSVIKFGTGEINWRSGIATSIYMLTVNSARAMTRIHQCATKLACVCPSC